MSSKYTENTLSNKKLRSILEFTLENSFYEAKGLFGDIVGSKRLILYNKEEVDLVPALLSLVVAMYSDKETRRRLSLSERSAIRKITNPYALNREKHMQKFFSNERTKEKIINLANKYNIRKLVGERNFEALSKVDDYLDYLDSLHTPKPKPREYKPVGNDEAPATLIELNTTNENPDDSQEYTFLSSNSGIQIDTHTEEERIKYTAIDKDRTVITFFERKDNKNKIRYFTLSEKDSHNEDKVKLYANILIQKALRKDGRFISLKNTHLNTLRDIAREMSDIYRDKIEMNGTKSLQEDTTRPEIIEKHPSQDKNPLKIA